MNPKGLTAVSLENRYGRFFCKAIVESEPQHYFSGEECYSATISYFSLVSYITASEQMTVIYYSDHLLTYAEILQQLKSTKYKTVLYKGGV